MHLLTRKTRGIGLVIKAEGLDFERWEISQERQHWSNPISLKINRPFTQIIIQGDSDVIRKSLSFLLWQFNQDNQQQVRAQAPRVETATAPTVQSTLPPN